MKLKSILAATSIVLSAGAVQAQDSIIVLGKSTYNARCALCHGEDGKGGGEIAGLFEAQPPNLVKLSENAGGKFPFPRVYDILVTGMQERGHGDSQMPIWGDYFMSDALEDRGVLPGDAIAIAAGRITSLAYYLETIQE